MRRVITYRNSTFKEELVKKCRPGTRRLRSRQVLRNNRKNIF